MGYTPRGAPIPSNCNSPGYVGSRNTGGHTYLFSSKTNDTKDPDPRVIRPLCPSSYKKLSASLGLDLAIQPDKQVMPPVNKSG